MCIVNEIVGALFCGIVSINKNNKLNQLSIHVEHYNWRSALNVVLDVTINKQVSYNNVITYKLQKKLVNLQFILD